MDKIKMNEREVYKCYNVIKDANCDECSFKDQCSPIEFQKSLDKVNIKIDNMKKLAIEKINKMSLEELEKFIENR